MSILEALSESFPPRIQERGDEYYEQRRVQIVESRAGYIRAIVRGTGRYRVEIKWHNGQSNDLQFRCGCPYFEDNNECKHIWATLRQSEQQKLLPQSHQSANGNGHDPDEDDDDWHDEALVQEQLSNARREDAPPEDEATPPVNRPRWQRALHEVRDQMLSGGEFGTIAPWPAQRRVVYVLDIGATVNESAPAIELMSEDVIAGRADRLKPLRLSRANLPKLPDPEDAAIVQMLLGSSRGAGVVDDFLEVDHHYLLPESSAEAILRRMIATGRCRLRHHESAASMPALQWDESEPWSFVLSLRLDPREPIFWLTGELKRTDEIIDVREGAVVLRGGLMVRGDAVSRVNDGGAFDLISLLRGENPVFVPEAQVPQLLTELFALPRLPELRLPEGYAFTETRVAPKPRLTIAKPAGAAAKLVADLSFDYAGVRVPAKPQRPALFDPATNRLIWRDRAAEASAVELVHSLGLKSAESRLGDDGYRLPANRLGRTVATLVAEGWIVEAEGKIYRRGGKFNVRVASGIDWLELTGGIDFEGQSAALPELLEAARSGEKLVKLGDGTFGVLPDDWLQQYGLLAAMGQVDGEAIKFSKQQVGLLDALLATLPEASWDESFTKLRGELKGFEGVQAVDASAGFAGELRHYQKDGLGWLTFLRKLGFGGCLADDMGLGKTIQILAMLQKLKKEGASGPSLVVVPRSLIFNWQSEAANFTPELRIIDHSGAQRAIPSDGFAEYDIVLSTYGTVRRDAVALKDVPFNYVILDEAQAIKNSQSESAKAVRVLKARHRLALSGTPVQNHLGELWSLFEFLNPGLLGTAPAFKSISTSGAVDSLGREALSRALRPFILRRTKGQVAPELPDKLEQTIVCELDREQRRAYNELREHYRTNLLTQVAKDGIGKSKMQILEALLRLRQAACHPGLIDKKRVDESSAKLDALIPQLEEVGEEGHKALVFSQFTSFLSILRKKLDARGVVYEYLDGKTTDRQKRVRRFQNDPDCKLFLISLKAGGLGLNLTQAEYVFLLDPWWNPAVEQQAIDRTHRIGQTRQVFAYRLIARDTVEQKVLELQKAKRDLADAIITADNSLISSMGREELELLLS